MGSFRNFVRGRSLAAIAPAKPLSDTFKLSRSPTPGHNGPVSNRIASRGPRLSENRPTARSCSTIRPLKSLRPKQAIVSFPPGEPDHPPG